mmetsp:Transcript_13132/g.43259  ORF Transcript_13132/g.43259 Transcript_13132/m.43259 type:complete len:233 (-) Transcript_13132:29-727(-)
MPVDGQVRRVIVVRTVPKIALVVKVNRQSLPIRDQNPLPNVKLASLDNARVLDVLLHHKLVLRVLLVHLRVLDDVAEPVEALDPAPARLACGFDDPNVVRAVEVPLQRAALPELDQKLLLAGLRLPGSRCGCLSLRSATRFGRRGRLCARGLPLLLLCAITRKIRLCVFVCARRRTLGCRRSFLLGLLRGVVRSFLRRFSHPLLCRLDGIHRCICTLRVAVLLSHQCLLGRR